MIPDLGLGTPLVIWELESEPFTTDSLKAGWIGFVVKFVEVLSWVIKLIQTWIVHKKLRLGPGLYNISEWY